MSMQTLALAFMAATAIGGLAWVFIYPLLSGEKKAESRRASIARSEPAAARQADKTQRSRREQVEGSLKELDARRKKEKSVALSVRIAQAGLTWTTQKFWIVSSVSAVVGFVAAYVVGGYLVGAAVMAFATGLGLPRGSRFGTCDRGTPGFGLLLARQQRIDEDPCQAADGGGGHKGQCERLHAHRSLNSPR